MADKVIGNSLFAGGEGGPVEFRLLGPVEVYSAGGLVDAGQPRQRCVVAALAAEVGRPVPIDTLVDRVWGEHLPRQPRRALYFYLTGIRKMIQQADPGGTARLVRRSGGYLLDVEPDRVDVYRFRRLVAQARDGASSDAERVELLRRAVELWRGPPLADLPGEWPARVRASWQDEYLDAVTVWAPAEQAVSNAAGAVGRLSELVAQYPLNEALAAVLMRVLHAAGRGPEALDCYARVRARLSEQLGVDPGAELQDVHRAILRGDPGPASPGPASPPPPARVSSPAPAQASSPVPAQLPADVSGFTGRGEALARLDTLLATRGGRSTAVVIVAVSGMAGVGKTALAVHWAHRVRDRFPDGQLYLNLRGFDPAGAVVDPAPAMRGFLDALGVPAQRIPADLDGQAALYRSLLADKRMLVVLDNARDAAQVRPLLPAAPGCLVLITSRNQLASLIAGIGAHPLALDLLTPTEARDLLTRRLGADRLAVEPEAVAEIITRCARLPLALAVMAARAATNPHLPLSALAAELTDARARLDALTDTDPTTDVRAVFSWSYQALAEAAAALFRLLGLHPGADFDLYAAAALTGADLSHARDAVDVLVHAHLVHVTDVDRYGVHDLLRAYAAELTTTNDVEDDRRAALTRLFDYYLTAVSRAMDAIHPDDTRSALDATGVHTPPVTDPAAVLAWLDAERPSLLAACVHAANHGWPRHTIRLAATLFAYLDFGSHDAEALMIYSHARRAAHELGDKTGEAHFRTSLGSVYSAQGRIHDAEYELKQALALSRQTGDPYVQARAFTTLGGVCLRLGRYDEATGHHRRALALFRETADRVGETRAHNNLGVVYERQGRYAEAADHLEQALARADQTGELGGKAGALVNLGQVYTRLRRYDDAADHLAQALTLFREAGHRAGEGCALTYLGVIDLGRGDHRQAESRHRDAIDLFRKAGYRTGEVEALNNLAEVRCAGGDYGQARADYAAALHLADETDDTYEVARAHNGIAHTHYDTGNPDQARYHWRRALTIYQELNVPEANDVRANLAKLDGRTASDDEPPTG